MKWSGLHKSVLHAGVSPETYKHNTHYILFISCDAKAILGPKPPHYWSFWIKHRCTKICRTPLDEGSARRRDFYLTTHNTHETDIHAPGRIRTRNPRKRAAADPRLRQFGHRDQHIFSIFSTKVFTYCGTPYCHITCENQKWFPILSGVRWSLSDGRFQCHSMGFVWFVQDLQDMRVEFEVRWL